MSRLVSRSLLAVGLATALPAFAQSHAGHDMAMPAAAPVDHSKMDHSKMDHSKMDHSTMDHAQMDHAAMGHAMPAPSEPREPIPVPTDADRAAAFPPINHDAMEHAPQINSLLLIDRLEHWDGQDGKGQAWEASGWIGGDINRLWLRSDGERSGGRTESSSLEALYGRSVSPWWDVLVGVRQDFRPADSRTWAAIGIQGLAPYKFESSATLYLGSGGQVLAKAEVEYDVLLTNRLILQPLVEATLAAKDEPEHGIGQGLNKIEAGLRLRNEFSRRFAPYIGISHERSFGDAADHAGDHARDTRWVAGVRMWF
ncbi:copper resistance protein B [Stenotrophomonas sp. YAU14D1_LEIMI4_1]|uniref:copper resistance protein B n=1 Tax=Stenotrophomonas sp. YAU14D1_LEIMI4_1 TaxID=2072407 RepID=UPI000D5424EC|nr:copper resistance protein B [Stenotrophomonas sp. YAU14D1_LEIMI4_1]AWH26302.1 copper resistance protein CopB [Stenotrophomonas sp. YAU14D1_LEIMI4_1]